MSAPASPRETQPAVSRPEAADSASTREDSSSAQEAPSSRASSSQQAAASTSQQQADGNREHSLSEMARSREEGPAAERGPSDHRGSIGRAGSESRSQEVDAPIGGEDMFQMDEARRTVIAQHLRLQLLPLQHTAWKWTLPFS